LIVHARLFDVQNVSPYRDPLDSETLWRRVKERLLIHRHPEHLVAALAQQEKTAKYAMLIARNVTNEEAECQILSLLSELHHALSLLLQRDLFDVLVCDGVSCVLLHGLEL